MSEKMPEEITVSTKAVYDAEIRNLVRGTQEAKYTRADIHEAVKAERDALIDFIRMRGYVPCDIAACNCGSYHGGHAERRLSEIYDCLEARTQGKTALQAIDALKAENERLRGELRNIGCSDTMKRPIQVGQVVHWTDGGDELDIEERIATRWDRIAVVEKNPDIGFRVIDTPYKKSSCMGHTFKYGSFIYTDTHNYLTIVAESEDEYHEKFKSAGDCMRYVLALKGGAE